MDLTDDEKQLASISKAFHERKEEIEDLIFRLLHEGESQTEVAREFGQAVGTINRKAKRFGAPRVYGPDGFQVFVDQMRDTVLKELKPGDKFWGQKEARAKFECGSGRLASARNELVKEGVLETVLPGGVDTMGYRRRLDS